MTPIDGPSPGAPDVPGARSVAEEAALLVDLLSRRGWPASPGRASARPPRDGKAPEGAADAPEGHHAYAHGWHETRPDGHGGRAAPGAASGDAPGDAPGGGAASEGDATEGSASECTCGGRTPAACRVCPVCQLIAFVQQVNPDTIDRVADFVGFAATALRDLATAQRDRRAEPDDVRPEPPAQPGGEPDRTGPGDPT